MPVPRKSRLLVAIVVGSILLAFTSSAEAQQNLFNVPSGKITDPGNVFFQEQFNFTQPTGTSNTTIDFGLGQGWEAGVNVLNIDMYENVPNNPDAWPQQEKPGLLWNAQKGFEMSDSWTLGIGGQFGFNPNENPNDVHFLNFSWAVNEFRVPEHEEFGKWYVGGYYANVAYAGPGSSGGFLLGSEIPIIEDRLSFQWDWVGGTSDISELVIGGVYTLRNKWQVSIGAQVPSPWSENPYGLVLELTYPGYPLFGRKTPSP